MEGISIDIRPEMMANIRREAMRDDFAFIVGGREHRCDPIVASFISPLVSLALSSDPTANSFSVDLPPDLGFDFDFSRVFSLFSPGSLFINKNEIECFASVFRSLGNETVAGQLDSLLIDEASKSPESLVEAICRLCKSKPAVTDTKLIDNFASHFYEIIDKIDDRIPDSMIEAILTSSSLKISDESSLFNFVRSRIIESGRSSFLLGFVRLEFLSIDDMIEFVELVDYRDLDINTWEQIVNRLCLDVKRLSVEISPRYHISTLCFTPDGTNNFKGIFNYFNKVSGGNCIENRAIKIKNTEMYDSNFKESNLVDYSDFLESYFSFKNIPYAFITFDFGEYKVNPTHYAMHTSDEEYFPKSWKIEGSNDDLNWTLLDSRSNCNLLNGKNLSVLFEVSNKTKESFRFISLQTTGKCFAKGEDRFDYIISGLELYGNLIALKE